MGNENMTTKPKCQTCNSSANIVNQPYKKVGKPANFNLWCMTCQKIVEKD